MKRLLAVTLLLLAGTSYAVGPVTIVRSSFTKTNDTAVCLSSAAFLSGVNVTAVTTGGSLSLYNSSWTTSANLLIDSISLNSAIGYQFQDLPVQGICYTTAANLNGVQILYRR